MYILFGLILMAGIAVIAFSVFVDEKLHKEDDGLDPHERYLNARHKQIDKIDKANGWQ